MFKVNKTRNTRKNSEIFSKWTIKTSDYFLSVSHLSISIVDLEQVSVGWAVKVLWNPWIQKGSYLFRVNIKVII